MNKEDIDYLLSIQSLPDEEFQIAYLERELEKKENIIKEVREILINSKEYKMAKEMNLTSKMSVLIELLEILDKGE